MKLKLKIIQFWEITCSVWVLGNPDCPYGNVSKFWF